MAYEFTLRRRVEFHETDAAGIVYYANFFRYFEAVEAAFLRSLGLTLHHPEGSYSWPRVDVRCRYVRPVRFEEELDVHLLVVRKGEKHLEYLLRIYADPDQARALAAEAWLTVVCASADAAGGKMRARALPEQAGDRIKEAPAALLQVAAAA